MLTINFTQEDINSIITRYSQGESTTKIAISYNCKYRLILKLLKKHNIIKKQKINLNTKQKNKIIKLYENQSIKDISKLLQISQNHIASILKENNILIKPSHSHSSYGLNNQIINDFYHFKLNYQQIADKNNCSVSLVKKIIMIHVKSNSLPCYHCNSNQNLIKNNKRQIICLVCQQKISLQTTWTWQIDHIQPVSTFKFASINDPEFKICWGLNNLRPLSSKQNYLDGVRRTRHK